MRIGVLALTLLLSGCASLLVRQDDSVPVVVSKVFWRSILGVSTLGLSEVQMAQYRDSARADERLQDYEEHLTYLLNNELLAQAEAERLYQDYAALLLQDTTDPYEQRIGYLAAATSTFGAGLGMATGLVPYSFTSSSWRPVVAQHGVPQWRRGSGASRSPYWRSYSRGRAFGFSGGRRSGGMRGGGKR
jgi:hypothetical protein